MPSLSEFNEFAETFENYLTDQLTNLYPSDSHLHQACRYALSGGGKRVRPVLMMLSAEACDGDRTSVLPAALAIEMIHTYSLVHDDLPCMDDDDLRRGRPTVHKVYDDAIALLVGDALLSDAFALIASGSQSAEQIVAAVQCLAQASGGQGMVAGQDADMFWTGKSGYSAQDLEYIHHNKTGRLLAAACKIGALLSPCPQHAIDLEEFGAKLGLSFQIIDDLLDEEENTGKSQGKDQQQGKLTFLSFMTRDDAKEKADAVTQAAFSALASLPRRSSLESFGLALLCRKK